MAAERPKKDGLFEILLNTAVDGIVVIDSQGLVRIFNCTCEKLFGYAVAEVIGQNVKLLMPSPYREEHDGYLAHYRTTGERRIIGIGREVSGRRKDGSTFPMYLSVGEGMLDGERIFVGIIHDLTGRKAGDAALEESAATLRTVLDTGPDAIIVIDERGIVESFNETAERMFRWPAAEVIGQNVKILMPSPYHKEHDAYIERYLETGERHIIGIGRVAVGQRRDGSTFPIELAVGEVRVYNRRLFTGFIRDITIQRGTERRLQELHSELLHVSRLSAMGQMASALAHELNQPLTAIVNYLRAAQRSLETVNEETVARVRELMDKAGAQSTRAGQIIRRLRAFIEKRESDRHPENLNQVVEESIALGLAGGMEHSVRIHFMLDARLRPVFIDKIQMQQVLINLIRNAVEAMQGEKRQELTITTAADADNQAHVSIADTGPGLVPEVAARLFQPFVTSKEKGMGIGLTICQSIVEAHGGRIWAAPNPDGGVTFHFLLPFAPEE